MNNIHNTYMSYEFFIDPCFILYNILSNIIIELLYFENKLYLHKKNQSSSIMLFRCSYSYNILTG